MDAEIPLLSYANNWSTTYTLKFDKGVLKSYSYPKGVYSVPNNAANSNYTYSDGSYSWTISFSEGSLTDYYRIQPATKTFIPYTGTLTSLTQSGVTSSTYTDSVSEGEASWSNWWDQWVEFAYARGKIGNRYVYLGSGKSGSSTSDVIAFYTTATTKLDSATWYLIAGTDIDNPGTAWTVEEGTFYTIRHEGGYKMGKIETSPSETIRPQNASGYYVDGTFTLYTAGSSKTSTVNRVYLYPEVSSTYRTIGTYLLSGSATAQTLALDRSQYIRFSIGGTTLYLCSTGSGYKVYTSAPSFSSSTVTIPINKDSTPNEADRTFFFGCAKMSIGTSSTGSPDKRTNVVNSNSVNNCYLIFGKDGLLDTVSKQYTATKDASDKIVGIRNIAISSSSLGSRGMVFAGGYLIKNGCDLL